MGRRTPAWRSSSCRAAGPAPGQGSSSHREGIRSSPRATANLKAEAHRGLPPEDLIEIPTINGLHDSRNAEPDVLFHLIGALSQYGRIGVTAIGNSREEVERLYARTLSILDRETSYGH